MEISKTIKFVGPFNQQLIKKLFPIFLILNILLLPLKIYFSSSFLTEIISLFIDGIIFLLIINFQILLFKSQNILYKSLIVYIFIHNNLQKLLSWQHIYIYIYWIDNSNLYFRFILGFLRVLHKQIGHLEVVNLTTLKAKWRGVCLSLKHLEEILQSGVNNQLPYYQSV